jgi:hypothetical protein
MFSFTYYVKICIESSSHNVHINTSLHALVDKHIFKYSTIFLMGAGVYNIFTTILP